jgi:hypothetical protein
VAFRLGSFGKQNAPLFHRMFFQHPKPFGVREGGVQHCPNVPDRFGRQRLASGLRGGALATVVEQAVDGLSFDSFVDTQLAFHRGTGCPPWRSFPAAISSSSFFDGSDSVATPWRTSTHVCP